MTSQVKWSTDWNVACCLKEVVTKAVVAAIGHSITGRRYTFFHSNGLLVCQTGSILRHAINELQEIGVPSMAQGSMLEVEDRRVGRDCKAYAYPTKDVGSNRRYDGLCETK